MFDDEIDPGGDLMSDDAGTRRICDQTLQCIDECLHPDPKQSSFTAPVGSPGTVEMLYGILGTMRHEMGPATVERMRRQLHEYVEGVVRQQSVRQDDRLPDPWYHLKLRCDDIGVRPSVTQIEYAMGFELPDHIVYHEAMECVVLDCTKLCVLVNEILSLEKEFVSLLPLPLFPNLRTNMCHLPARRPTREPLPPIRQRREHLNPRRHRQGEDVDYQALPVLRGGHRPPALDRRRAG